MQQKQIKNVKESLVEKQKQEANKSQVNINEVGNSKIARLLSACMFCYMCYDFLKRE